VELTAVARELRAARDNLKLSREQLAERIGYTASYIEKIETGKLAATEPYVAAAAKVLAEGIDATELFQRLRDDERREVVPGWFQQWVEHEQEATEIRWYEPLLVPGLLQTEGYATVLLEDAERVAFRMERQQVLDRAMVTAVIAEAVLTYRIGSPDVMREQLGVLAESRAVVQVLPNDADTHLGTLGSFILATVDDSEVAYADSPLRGHVTADTGVVLSVRRRWEVLRGEALPQRQSRELILRRLEERWKSES
jgi:transcriptional regulator with XRE-family HTH domain